MKEKTAQSESVFDMFKLVRMLVFRNCFHCADSIFISPQLRGTYADGKRSAVPESVIDPY
ncbi:hypothetical protein HMPREF0178_03910, partial [Bilophila sp. 4_1_30]